jgi:TetR/AcrR family transcriptional regulator, regulator of autoinduction and epiphytic fitness
MSTSAEDPRIARTRQAVIEGVRAVIGRHGIQGLSFEAVAAAAQVSRTTLYRYWPTREALVRDGLYELTRPARPMVVSDELETDLRVMFGHLIDALTGVFTGPAIASLIDAGERDPDMSELLSRTVEHRRAPAVGRIGVASDGTTHDPELLHDLVAGAIYYRRFVRRVPTTDADLDELVRTITSVLASGTPRSKD